METVQSVKRTIRRIGFKENGSTHIRTKIYLLFLMLNSVDLVISIFKNRDDIDSIILAIKELNNHVFVFTLVIGLPGLFSLGKLVSEQHVRISLQNFIPDLKSFKDDRNTRLNKIGKHSYWVLVMVFVIYNFLPFFQAVYIILTRDRIKVDVQELPFVYYFYYPKNSSLYLYFTVMILQMACSATSISILYLVFNSGFISVRSTLSELEQISTAVKEIDNKILLQNECQTPSEGQGVNIKSTDSYNNVLNVKNLNVENLSVRDTKTSGSEKQGISEEEDLRVRLREIINQHQHVCSDMIVLNNGLKTFILACNNSFGIQICMSIYCMMQLDGFFVKAEYLIMVFWIIFIMKLYTEIGQQISDEGVNLRWTLWESSWLDKPAWYKKSLLIMMTRATRDVEIKPYGLYVLNLKNLTNVINAAYSYFNLLQNFK